MTENEPLRAYRAARRPLRVCPFCHGGRLGAVRFSLLRGAPVVTARGFTSRPAPGAAHLHEEGDLVTDVSARDRIRAVWAAAASAERGSVGRLADLLAEAVRSGDGDLLYRLADTFALAARSLEARGVTLEELLGPREDDLRHGRPTVEPPEGWAS